MGRIDIDDEVYVALGKRAIGFQQPNDVLREMLALEDIGLITTALVMAPARPGRLAPLLTEGLIQLGERLVHVQTRKGQTFGGRVERDGWIVTDRGRSRSRRPSSRTWPAAESTAGSIGPMKLPGGPCGNMRAESGSRPRGWCLTDGSTAMSRLTNVRRAARYGDAPLSLHACEPEFPLEAVAELGRTHKNALALRTRRTPFRQLRLKGSAPMKRRNL